MYSPTIGALEALAHESIHLSDLTAGKPEYSADELEHRAECLGMAQLEYVVTTLGGTPEDAAAIRFAYDTIVRRGTIGKAYQLPC